MEETEQKSTATSVVEAQDAAAEITGASQKPEIKFLQGPQSRGFELRLAIDIFIEFIRGFRALHFVGPCVTVFGSARFKEDHPYYVEARRVGRLLAEAGFTVMTGGGPGIMEAANRGAKDVDGRSVGCNIELPQEQHANPYLDKMVEFKHFFVRKVMLIKYSYAFIAMPGGYGTLDEIYDAATLIQTGKIQNFPLVLFGSEFWAPLLEQMRGPLLKHGAISEADLSLITITDSAEEVVASIRDVAMSRFGLSYAVRARRRWWLWE